MQRLRPTLFFCLIVLLLASCDTTSLENEAEAPVSSRAISASDVTAGDRVVTNTAAGVFSNPQNQIGTVPTGSAGTVVRARSQGGVDWIDVNFDDAALPDGFVDGLQLDLESDPDPDPDPNPDPCQGDVEYGFIGMSNTYQMARGMRRLGWDCKIWTADITEGEGDSPVQGIGKGTIGTWAQPSSPFNLKVWSSFNYGIEQYPNTRVILWEVAIGLRDQQDDVAEPNTTEKGWLLDVYNQAKAQNPDLTFVIYGMPDYEEPCPQTGSYGPTKADALADIAVDPLGGYYLSDVTRGPVLPIVMLDDLGHDSCHLDTGGEDIKAQAMIDWLEANAH